VEDSGLVGDPIEVIVPAGKFVNHGAKFILHPPVRDDVIDQTDLARASLPAVDDPTAEDVVTDSASRPDGRAHDRSFLDSDSMGLR
jgi:hypothetical protein